MLDYKKTVEHFEQLIAKGGDLYKNISAENAARMDLQNRFKTGLDIAKYTADIMHKDMSEYDGDSSVYTQSLGCWHGFTAQQMMMEIKKSRETTNKRYVYLSGWMVAALRSDFGPLPDQSMHEKTSVPKLIKEIYTFLKRADSIQLQHLFNELDEVRSNGGNEEDVIQKIDSFETHVVPIIADIDAGFGNEEATYLLARKMIESGACAIQIENQVSDEKQCGHQDGKVTVPHEDFISKINAVRYAFLELGVENGIIVARTDSLGAGLTQKVPVWLRFESEGKPGHGSSPYESSSVTRLLDGLQHLKNNPFPPKIIPSVGDYFQGLSKIVNEEYSNEYKDIKKSIKKEEFIKALQKRSPFHHSLTRDTCSITRLGASNKINVVPPLAWAEIDCRILPDQPAEEFIFKITKMMEPFGIKVKKLMAFTPASSSIDTEFYKIIRSTLLNLYPEAHIIPRVTTGFTDSHFTRDIGINSYGFNPIIIPLVEFRRIHGNDERVNINAFKTSIYDHLKIIENFVYD